MCRASMIKVYVYMSVQDSHFCLYGKSICKYSNRGYIVLPKQWRTPIM